MSAESIRGALAEVLATAGVRCGRPFCEAPDRDCEDCIEHRAHVADALAAPVREERAGALEEAVDALVWVMPERSPCAPSFEGCCGSEAYCDGEDWQIGRAHV